MDGYNNNTLVPPENIFQMKALKAGDIRKAIEQLKKLEHKGDILLPVKNFELFEKFVKAGRMVEYAPGKWGLID